MSALDENPNCSRTYATFRVSGDALNPDEVGAVLGLTPTRAFAKDQAVSVGRKGTRPQRTGVWLLATEDRIDSTSLERHLIHLLIAVEHATAALASLRATRGLMVDFFCFWESATGHGGPEMSPATLARISALDAALAIDFYSLDTDQRD